MYRELDAPVQNVHVPPKIFFLTQVNSEKKLNVWGPHLISASGVAADVGRDINFGEIRYW